MAAPSSMRSIAARIAEELNVRVPQVTAAVALLDGNTQLRALEERLTYLRDLENAVRKRIALTMKTEAVPAAGSDRAKAPGKAGAGAPAQARRPVPTSRPAAAPRTVLGAAFAKLADTP